jgi:hypothetical protein
MSAIAYRLLSDRQAGLLNTFCMSSKAVLAVQVQQQNKVKLLQFCHDLAVDE